jgi:hypothetical protein
MAVNPDTGFMNYKNKFTTMFIELEYFADGSLPQPSGLQPFPFPDLEGLVGLKVPVYNFLEDLSAGQA